MFEHCLSLSVYSKYLSVPHTVPSVRSVSLCPLLSSTVCPLSVSTSHCTVCWFYVTMSTAVLYSLSSVCHYPTLYRLLVLCHYVDCCRLQSLQCLPVRHNVPCVCSVPPCPLLSYTISPLSFSTSHSTVPLFCATVTTAVFYSLSNVCQYLTLYRLLFLCHYVRCWLLQSVQCLSIPHNVPSVGSVSLCPLLSSKVFALSVSTSHCTVCWFCVTIHCCLLQSVHCLSVPHTVQSVSSVSLCPLLSSTVCPLSVSISYCTVC